MTPAPPPTTSENAPSTNTELSSNKVVTFLMTDIVGSTHHWEHHPAAMRAALLRHDTLATNTLARYSGAIVKQRGEGDSLFVVFEDPCQALHAAIAFQEALIHEHWDEECVLRVRIALHSGAVYFSEGDYFGGVVQYASRLRTYANGGQILLSQDLYQTLKHLAKDGISFQSLGVFQLREVAYPDRIYQLNAPNLPSRFPRLRFLGSAPNNLPQQVTAFIGREREVSEVLSRLEGRRLVTLIGDGGIGKTRLALEVAERLLSSDLEGVWLIELSPIHDAELLPQAIGTALGIRQEPHQSLTESLCSTLKPQNLLLIWDSCDHLLSACADFAQALMQECPRLRIIATSYESLQTAEEAVYPLNTLSTPEEDSLQGTESYSEAVALIADRVTRIQPLLLQEEGAMQALKRISLRLDGIPFALEMAAAHLRAMPPERIVTLLNERFRALTGSTRTPIRRQQTVRTLIDWNYSLLSPSEKLLLQRLSVFAGGWTLEAAEQICADDPIELWEILDLLTVLVDSAFIVYEEIAGQPRYRFHDTILHYAQERFLLSEESTNVRGKQATYFATLAEKATTGAKGAELAQRLQLLDQEQDNLRAALEFCIEAPTHTETGLQLAIYLGTYWITRGRFAEGRIWLARLITAEVPPSDALRAQAYLTLGAMAWNERDPINAEKYYNYVLEYARSVQDRRLHARAVGNLGNALALQGKWEQARKLYLHANDLFQTLDDTLAISSCYANMGEIALAQRDFLQAEICYAQALSLRENLQDTVSSLQTYVHLAVVRIEQGEFIKARERLTRTLKRGQQLGAMQGVADAIEGFALLNCRTANYMRSAILLGCAAKLRALYGLPVPAPTCQTFEVCFQIVCEALGEEDFQRYRQQGRAYSVEQIIAYALEPEAANR